MPRRATRPLTVDNLTPPERRWIRLLQEWQTSGLQGSKWCRRQGLKESAFRFWKKEIVPRARRRQERHVESSSSVKLLPVRVVEAARPVAILPLEVVLGRRSIRVAGEFDAAVLRNVVQALE